MSRASFCEMPILGIALPGSILWEILNPVGHVVRRISNEARDVGPRSHTAQRRTDIPIRARNARNFMAAAALILSDQVRTTTHVAVEIVGSCGHAWLAGGKSRGHQSGGQHAKDGTDRPVAHELLRSRDHGFWPKLNVLVADQGSVVETCSLGTCSTSGESGFAENVRPH